MEKRILRFKHCDSRFYPYLEKVLNRLPDEIKEDILNNKNLQILGNKNILIALGMHLKFDEPITNIVYLNTLFLKRPEHIIIHAIAHELAHYVAGKGKTGLREKEAEEMVVKWGFDKESEKVEYHRPILESWGYEVGYNWASKQKDQDLIDNFKEFFEDWDNDRLSGEQLEKLIYDLDPISIMAEMGQLEGGGDTSEESDKIMIMDGVSGDKGIIWGVMGRLKEIFAKQSSHYVDEDASKTEFFKTLEEINKKFDRLFSLNAYGEFFKEMHRYEIPNISVKVDMFLKEYREN